MGTNWESKIPSKNTHWSDCDCRENTAWNGHRLQSFFAEEAWIELEEKYKSSFASFRCYAFQTHYRMYATLCTAISIMVFALLIMLLSGTIPRAEMQLFNNRSRDIKTVAALKVKYVTLSNWTKKVLKFLMDLQPLSFSCSEKMGMLQFAELLVELEQSYSTSLGIDDKNCYVRVSQWKKDWPSSENLHEQSKQQLHKTVGQGCRVTSDSGKVHLVHGKYYNFVIIHNQ